VNETDFLYQATGNLLKRGNVTKSHYLPLCQVVPNGKRFAKMVVFLDEIAAPAAVAC